MSETINDMRKRHAKEIENLQDFCEHKRTKWFKYMWAPGHYDGQVKVCLKCDKHLDKRGSITQISTNFGSENTII